MPHKPASKDGGVPAFVSVSLTVELKPALKAYAERNADDIGNLIEAVVMAGYGFGCKAEDKTGFQASLRATEWVKNTNNKGKILVERAGTAQRAILRLFWAHYEVLEGTWPDGIRTIDDDW